MSHQRSIPVTLTPSAEIDRSSYGSSALERAGVKLSTNVQMAHLKKTSKDKPLGIKILKNFKASDGRCAAASPGEA